MTPYNQRAPAPLPRNHHGIKGPFPSVAYKLYKDPSSPVARHYFFKGLNHDHHKFKGPCPSVSPLAQPNATRVPEQPWAFPPTAVPTLPMVTTLPPVVTDASSVPPTLPVSTQSGAITTARVETGRRQVFLPNQPV
ncbi:hypothetical protein DPEC_G00319690 [Dallia pectoralis]|uniref:Uncharacterized protein n=1 Tax=Dallia pectoralis TaxID=75939 RepID=A0ACC2F9L6_DALPE|nr:hypothetical protein DPEC_G00319690 [Dallia pectoralis]